MKVKGSDMFKKKILSTPISSLIEKENSERPLFKYLPSTDALINLINKAMKK